MATLESMERLINDADNKFEEKLKAVVAGHSTNLSAFADRTYNLRQQIAHNASLTNDDHFMELLVQTERYLSPEYVVRGEMEKKLTALLAGLLKTLLRETVAITTYAARKIQIEMIWQWYQDKQKHILDLTLKRMDAVFTPSDAPSTAQAAPTATEDDTSRARDAAASKGDGAGKVEKATRHAVEIRFTPPETSPTSKRVQPLSFTEDAQRESELHEIRKKMGLFRKRNLMKAERLRQEMLARRGAGQGGVSTEPRVVFTRDRKPTPQQDRPSTVPARTAVSGPSPFIHARETQDKDAATARLQTAVLASQRHWVKRMIQRVEEENDRREMQDVLTTLCFNQARLEEETSRRLESEQYASQAGRTCHTILRRLPREGDSAPSDFRSTMPSATMPKEEALEKLGHAFYHGNEISLSPYDAYEPTALDERRLQALLGKVKAVGPESSRFSETRMRISHPRNVVGTPVANINLDVAMAPEAQANAPVPRSDVPLMEQLFPALQKDEDVPSLARMEQLRLVDRIREAVGRLRTKNGDHFHVPRSEIEKAIVIADDRPYDECFRLLPRPSSAFPANPFSQGPDRKGGKKKGAKKK